MITIRNLGKTYNNKEVVSDVSMDIEAGTITVIVGTSGSGKSTLLRMINRLIEPTTGFVEIDGINTRNFPAHNLRRQIGYVIQDNGLFPHWTVHRNIATVPKLLGWSPEQVETRVNELLSLLQLDPQEIGPRYPHQLSGGQAQRVGVARALAARPSMLLMDEPFGALDPVIRGKAQTDLKNIQKKLGSTILLVTHDMTEAIRLGDRIAVMNEGKVEQLATPSEILARPNNDHVRQLVGDEDRSFHLLSLIPAASFLESGSAEGSPLHESLSLLSVLSEMIWSGRREIPIANDYGQTLGHISLNALLAAGMTRP